MSSPSIHNVIFILSASLAACNGAPTPASPLEASGSAKCAPGTRCLAVNSDGVPTPGGASIAQCSGRFPDYIVEASQIPAGYTGPWFQLSQQYPRALPRHRDEPWMKYDFRKGGTEADRYLYALRNYAFDGMIEAGFVPQRNRKRAWYHAPLMNYGPNRRELVHGMTRERPVTGPELGVKPGTTISNFAVGFYNEAGAYVIGKVFASLTPPQLQSFPFPVGAMVFKVLFTTARREDFADPAAYPVAGAPAWKIAMDNGTLTTVHLLQMDVAVRDDRAAGCGWVFGTFAFDPAASDLDPWRRMRPVGLMWGNDPGYTPENQQLGDKLKETFISDQAPAYARNHLGWAGRLNGPVDNPVSACLSCHSTAEYPIDAVLTPPASCTTDEQKLYWFRDLSGTTAFGVINPTSCQPEQAVPAPVSLDLSLQIEVGLQNLVQYHAVDPCVGLGDQYIPTLPSPVRPPPRVER